MTTRHRREDRRSRARDSIGAQGLIEGSEVVPNLRLIRQIAEGGMGAVWEAEHLTLGTQVAVKFVVSQHRSNRTAIRRLEGEAAASVRVRSPHIVQVLDQGVTADGLRYMTMELLIGEDLERRLGREARLPLGLVARIVNHASKGLEKAHAVGVIHRDIKPSNLFLCDSPNDPFVKILDFGIARLNLEDFENPRLTQTGVVIGTPAFMAPEQMIQAKNVGPKADMWSLGVVTYVALTGNLPYEAQTIAGLALAIERGTFKPATEWVSQLPVEVDRWFERALSKDPDARHASVREMARELAVLAVRSGSLDVLDEVAWKSAPPPSLDDDATVVSPPALQDLAKRTPVPPRGDSSAGARSAPESTSGRGSAEGLHFAEPELRLGSRSMGLAEGIARARTASRTEGPSEPETPNEPATPEEPEEETRVVAQELLPAAAIRRPSSPGAAAPAESDDDDEGDWETRKLDAVRSDRPAPPDAPRGDAEEPLGPVRSSVWNYSLLGAALVAGVLIYGVSAGWFAPDPAPSPDGPPSEPLRAPPPASSDSLRASSAPSSPTSSAPLAPSADAVPSAVLPGAPSSVAPSPSSGVPSATAKAPLYGRWPPAQPSGVGGFGSSARPWARPSASAPLPTSPSLPSGSSFSPAPVPSSPPPLEEKASP